MKTVAAFILKLSTDRRRSGQGQSGHKKLFVEVDKSSGEIVNLTPNASNTVQPVALMRLGVFVPTLKSLKNRKRTRFRVLMRRKN